MISVALLLGLGFVLALTPLILSMNPSAKAIAEVRSFDSTNTPVGKITEIRYGDRSVLVARHSDTQYTVFSTSKFQFDSGQEYFYIYPGSIYCASFSMSQTSISCDDFDGRVRPMWDLSGQPLDAGDFALEVLSYSVMKTTVRFGSGAKS